MQTESQKLAIQRHLSKPGQSLTPIDARRLFRCDRLGARMKSELIPVGEGKRVARYSFDRKGRPCRKVRK